MIVASAIHAQLSGLTFGTLQAPNLAGQGSLGDDGAIAYIINSDGSEQTEEFPPTDNVTHGDWIGSGSNGQYECMLTVTSGDGPIAGPTTATWHLCSTTRRWELDGNASGVWRIRIRRTTDDLVGLDRSFDVDTSLSFG